MTAALPPPKMPTREELAALPFWDGLTEAQQESVTMLAQAMYCRGRRAERDERIGR